MARKSKKVLINRRLLRQLGEALYWAVRTDWDRTEDHLVEDALLEVVEKKLKVKFPLKAQT